MYDVAIIGAGIVGSAVAYTLSNYDIKVVVIEKEDDVAKGTTRANSAIIHAGYDPKPESIMAKSNVRGSILWKEIASSLNLEYIQTGSLVVAKNEEEHKVIIELYENGLANSVEEIEVISAVRACEIEPNLKKDIFTALYAKTAAIINPYQSCIAFCEYAIRNGTDFLMNSEVTAIARDEDGYMISTRDHNIKAKYIVNAAGLYTEDIHILAGGKGFGTRSVKGEYYLLDKTQGSFVSTVVFPVPSASGKGVLVGPTVHGNLLIGPTSEGEIEKDNTETTSIGLEAIRMQASLLFDNLPFFDNIRNFAGNRAYIDSDDFVVARSEELPDFINLAGIKSPGLSSAPALAENVLELLESSGLNVKKKEMINEYRYTKRFAELTEDEQIEAVRNEPKHGRVICRCETVTEGDIISALSSSLTPATVSAVKRRVNAGMGRCQGGFCSVRVHEIISKYRKIPLEEVTLDGKDSYIVYGDTKKGGNS